TSSKRDWSSDVCSSDLAGGEHLDRGEYADLDALEAGEIRVLTSVQVLTTGFDSPRVDCVLMARPTKSQGLYVQAVGRGLRLHPELGSASCTGRGTARAA